MVSIEPLKKKYVFLIT